MIRRLLKAITPHRMSSQYVLAVLVLSMVPIVVLSVTVSWHVRKTLIETSDEQTALGLHELDRSLIQRVEGYKIDVLTISAYPPIDGMHQTRRHTPIASDDGFTHDDWHARLTKLFIAYGRIHPAVEQIRLLDHNGVETLRVDQGEAGPAVVARQSLQNQSDRPYFRQAIKLMPGQCYVSPIDLHSEGGEIETNNPVMRISTPLWQGESLQGVIVVNISARPILDAIENHFADGRIIFANEAGSYMGHHDPNKAWGDQLGTGETLYADWPELTLAQLRAHHQTQDRRPYQLTSDDGQTKLALSYIQFGTHNQGWILGLERDRAEVLAASSAMNQTILAVTVFVLLIVAALALLSSLFWARPLRRLSIGLDTIRHGDYRVRIKNVRRDELGEMTRSFNKMAKTLEHSLVLERQRTQAQAASQAKSDFLANMSHEIRTPMNAILGFTAMLCEDSVTDDERDDYIKTIQRNGDHLLCLINDVLDLSKVEAGKMTVETTQTSLTETIGRVTSLMRGSAQHKGLDIRVQQADDLPDLIRTDAVRLRQVLLNLMGNAIKFTERGSVTLDVSHAASSTAGRIKVIFEITDTGIGIPADKLGHLFTPFSQAEASTARHFGGTGLGLSLSKQFANLLGGDIEAQSTPGVGSTFRFIIETTRDQGKSKRSAANHHDTATTPSDLKLEGRVLLAEDGIDNQRLITHHLKKMGIRYELRDNGQAALQCALEQRDAGNPFDVVLMDMQMPVMDGYTATKKLREQGYTHPIIALTAHAMQGDRQRCLAAGCDDYETKPIDQARLHKLLRTMIQKRHAA